MKFFRTIALCWLVFIVAYLGGIYTYDSKAWPYGPLSEIKQFFIGGEADKASLFGKIQNDLNFKPTRHIKLARQNGEGLQGSSVGFEFKIHKELNDLQINSRRINPKIFLSENAPQGYRIIYGTFDFTENLHGAIMLGPEGSVSHVWLISENQVDWPHREDENLFPHGFEIASDGTILVAYDGGTSLTKYDFCSRVLWQIEGSFHHSISFEDENSLWTWEGFGAGTPNYDEYLVKIDHNTGAIVKKISLREVMEANPEIDIFGILQEVNAEGSRWLSDYWHPNDIDPLPKELEYLYPSFRAGDLLVSLRSPNLIFVLDQESLKVKWWRQGLVRRQHDPDWNSSGTITIFNNNMHRGYSNIIEVDPSSYEHRIIYDGEKHDFYTWWRGKHEMTPNGGLLITSSDQGRVFEVDENGDLNFQFLNTYGEDDTYLALSEARFLPTDFFKELPQCEI